MNLLLRAFEIDEVRLCEFHRQFPQPLIGQIPLPYPEPGIYPRRKLNPFFIKIGGLSPTNCRTAGATLQREFNKSFQPS